MRGSGIYNHLCRGPVREKQQAKKESQPSMLSLLTDFESQFCARSCNYRPTLKNKSEAPCTGYARRKTYDCDICNFTASTPRTVGWYKKAKHMK